MYIHYLFAILKGAVCDCRHRQSVISIRYKYICILACAYARYAVTLSVAVQSVFQSLAVYRIFVLEEYMHQKIDGVILVYIAIAVQVTDGIWFRNATIVSRSRFFFYSFCRVRIFGIILYFNCADSHLQQKRKQHNNRKQQTDNSFITRFHNRPFWYFCHNNECFAET